MYSEVFQHIATQKSLAEDADGWHNSAHARAHTHYSHNPLDCKLSIIPETERVCPLALHTNPWPPIVLTIHRKESTYSSHSNRANHYSFPFARTGWTPGFVSHFSGTNEDLVLCCLGRLEPFGERNGLPSTSSEGGYVGLVSSIHRGFVSYSMHFLIWVRTTRRLLRCIVMGSSSYPTAPCSKSSIWCRLGEEPDDCRRTHSLQLTAKNHHCLLALCQLLWCSRYISPLPSF
jgi:hypothetical protein